MQEILEYIVKNLVSKPDEVEITSENQGKTKAFKVTVNQKDLGSVIGRGGVIANAIRTIVK
ncbi:MAG TPA: KH domain-containing protein, partial [Candidatus Onthoplasma faecigallinarum]|nr:KH domain-containing protein [Candidatus Onthoplasma faecigallinarum]